MSSLDEEQQKYELRSVLMLMKENGMVSIERDDFDKVIDKLLIPDSKKLSLDKLRKVKIRDDKVRLGANTIKYILNQLNIDELTFIGQRMRKGNITKKNISSFSKVREEEPEEEEEEEESDKGAGKGVPKEETMEQSGIPKEGLEAELKKDMEETQAPGTEDSATKVEMTMENEPAETHNESQVGDDVGEFVPENAEKSHKQANHQRVKESEGSGIEQAEDGLRDMDMDEERLAEQSPDAVIELSEMATQTETETEMATQTETEMAPAQIPTGQMQNEETVTAEMPPPDSFQNLLVSAGLMSRPQFHEKQLRNGLQMVGNNTHKLTQLPADNYNRLSNKQLADYIDAQIKIYGRKINVNKRLADVKNRKDLEQNAHEINALIHMYYMSRLGVSNTPQTGLIIPQEYLGALAPQLSAMTAQLRQGRQPQPQPPQQPQPQPQQGRGRGGFGQSQYANQLGLPVTPSEFTRTSRPKPISTTQHNQFKGRLGLRDRVKMNSARQEARKQDNRLEGLIFG